MTTANKDGREALTFALANAFEPAPPVGAKVTVGFIGYGCYAVPVNLTVKYNLGVSQCKSTIPRSLINAKPEFHVTMEKLSDHAWTLSTDEDLPPDLPRELPSGC